MSQSRREQTHSALQLIEVKKPLSALPENNGWNSAAGCFDWAQVEGNFNFVSMGRVVHGDTAFYFQPLPLVQLGYRPHPLALALHDELWSLHRLLQRTRGRVHSEAESGTIAESKKKLLELRRQIWAATFEPAREPVQAMQLSLL
ncbi:hypothetical protein [Hymenobacter mucosus]|uniref:Uncharacterized protein n=1 Tax=Hymenobacter mucosus TaxID=1411120 RepID=A0A239A2R7_9BACT|nr:hypothetical protein [Hymenobacter mucosus]SNR89789.1 hypothetical protein SAMN06269173_110150 [Hymenobacter mucosus]